MKLDLDVCEPFRTDEFTLCSFSVTRKALRFFCLFSPKERTRGAGGRTEGLFIAAIMGVRTGTNLFLWPKLDKLPNCRVMRGIKHLGCAVMRKYSSHHHCGRCTSASLHNPIMDDFF